MPRPRGDPGQTRYRQTQSVIHRVMSAVQAIWHGLAAPSIEAGLAGAAGAHIVDTVAAGQLTVAAGAQAYVEAAVAAQGATSAPAGALTAAAFAGIAADGRDLETLLFLPALTVRERLLAGAPDDEAMLAGLTHMAMLVDTQVADTARAADQTASVADLRVVAYTRIVNLPACARCIVLAGQQYSVSTGFLRHPRCDCAIQPISDKSDTPADPKYLYHQMSADERRRVFGPAGAEAIDAGADIAKVVNARRGMATATAFGRPIKATTEGATTRSLYGQRRRRAGDEFRRPAGGGRYARDVTTPRLMPEEILKQAKSRRDAVRLLRMYGYLT